MIDVHVRGIDPEVWRALRVEAVRQNISVARLIENLWMARGQQPIVVAGRGAKKR